MGVIETTETCYHVLGFWYHNLQLTALDLEMQPKLHASAEHGMFMRHRFSAFALHTYVNNVRENTDHCLTGSVRSWVRTFHTLMLKSSLPVTM